MVTRFSFIAYSAYQLYFQLLQHILIIAPVLTKVVCHADDQRDLPQMIRDDIQ